ncbi:MULTISPECIES: cytochrome P450 [Paenarthrobacter]|uniref:cytochrome P450 n=1 Tax=Paenarthrobacter TaxID=1742992 RepID=UPI0009EA6AEC|nr:cytochrome P450 [Paenarthrobacter ureafaciens]MBN9128863.1 cytochrome P450 [Paenarthrobacter ureafaciens]RWW95428.1 cytochrome P450 [Paenarthrobacter ureafaciens]UOD81792.1 cytochrome P450 [Paenarthrobacter ureafaciens]WNZ05283.1 cytochrome P450 [Paenarthrobacter ureafaciens]
MSDSQDNMVDFDPMSPEFIQDPHSVLHKLRDEAPIARSDRWGGFWAVTKRSDVVALAKNHKQFLNSVTHIVPGGMAGKTRPLMHADQPEHTDFREAMLPVFNGPLGDRLAPEVRAHAEELVAGMVARGTADLERDYAGPLMAYTLTRFYGMEGVDPKDLDRWLHQYMEGGQKREQGTVSEAHVALMKVATDLVEDRKANPRDPETDLVTALLQARPHGRPLDEEKLLGAVRQPFVIVWLATSHSLGNMLTRLVEDVALQDTLRRNPELIPEALEEFLRLDMPQLGFARTSAGDFEYKGKLFKDKEPIALVFPAANRDPEVFENPDEFRIGRTPNPHLTFGAGLHACPGKTIARAVVLAALESVIKGTGNFTLTAEIEREHWPFRASRHIHVDIAAPELTEATPDNLVSVN